MRGGRGTREVWFECLVNCENCQTHDAVFGSGVMDACVGGSGGGDFVCVFK